MIKKVFIDSDIVLDVATGRQPFVANSTLILSLAEAAKIDGYTSSNSITNIYYILRKLSDHGKALSFIKSIMQFIKIIPVTSEMIKLSMNSKFKDFEDGIQHFAAISEGCNYLTTRNVNDFKESKISVIVPIELLLQYQE